LSFLATGNYPHGKDGGGAPPAAIAIIANCAISGDWELTTSSLSSFDGFRGRAGHCPVYSNSAFM
jgi:hypothetical protein